MANSAALAGSVELSVEGKCLIRDLADDGGESIHHTN